MRISGDEMARIDRYSIGVLEIPAILLMENAALACLKHIDLVANIRYTLVCGVGNNGADALALARHLLNYDHEVQLIILGDKKRASEEFMTYYRILKNLGLRAINLREDSSLEDLEALEPKLKSADLIIDGIFGTGLNSNISGIEEYVIDMVNNAGREILSIDLPSGINANDGRVMGTCVDADKIVTFQFMKEGLYQNQKILGDIFVEPISIPKLAVNKALK